VTVQEIQHLAAALAVTVDAMRQQAAERERRRMDEAEAAERQRTAAAPRPRHVQDGRELPEEELPLQRTIAAGRGVEAMEFTLDLPGGRAVQLLGNTAPLFDAEGRVRGAVAACLDVTTLKATDRVLRDLNATLEQRVAERTLALEQAMAEQRRLEQATQRAEHFALLGRLAAGVAHELRNPLGAISLHVDLLAEELAQPSPDSPASVAEALAALKTDLARVDDLLQDSLTLVRVHTIQRAVQDLGPVVAAWGREFQDIVAVRGVTLQVDGLAILGLVAFHPSTLRRALLNLVQNAAEAMPPGGTVTLAGQGTADQVHLEVRDTGSGIPAARLAQIFEPLHTTKPGGTGLGLYIVQEVVAAHGGQVHVQSVEGQGTIFTLTLLRATPERSA
jgi:signal transduction histidine kinase